MGGNKIDVQKQKMLSAKDLKKAIKDAEKGEPDEVFDGAGNKIDVQKQIIVSSSRPNRRICEFANVVLFWNRVISFFSNFQIFCQKRDRAVAFPPRWPCFAGLRPLSARPVFFAPQQWFVRLLAIPISDAWRIRWHCLVRAR